MVSNSELAKTYSLPEEQVEQLKVLFEKFDLDKDGEITADEIYQAMQSVGSVMDSEVAKNIMRGADKNGDGKLDFSEFVAVLAPKFKSQGKKESLELAFDEFDKNADGYLTVQELHDAWNSLGMPLTPQEAAIMIAAVDKNGDGKVSLKEFKKIWKRM